MGGKRQRLDEDGRRVRQLELELELARLRREETNQDAAAAGDEENENEDPVVVPMPPLPPPAPQAMPYVATPATAPRQQRAIITTPRAGPSTPAGTSAATLAATGLGTTAARPPHQPTPQATQGFRGGRGGQGMGRPRNPGLTTVFVCVAHDALFCQVCCFYEKSTDYWARQGQN